MPSTVRMEQRHAVQFMARLGRTTSETHQLLTTAYQDDALRKPATRTYHNRFQTLGMNVYELTPKMRKNRTKRGRKAKTLPNIEDENNQKNNNLGSDAESYVSDDSFNDSFRISDKDSHSETDMNISNNSFDETAFQNGSTIYEEEQPELYDKEKNHSKEEEYSPNEKNNSYSELPPNNQNHDCIKYSEEIDSHNEQVRQSFINIDLEQSNVNDSNDNSHAENSTMMSTISVDNQHENDIAAIDSDIPDSDQCGNNLVENISATDMRTISVDNQYENDITTIESDITDSDQYESNLVENISATDIVPLTNTMQSNVEYESANETNDNRNFQQNGQGVLNRDESYTNHYYVNLSGELMLERNYFPEC